MSDPLPQEVSLEAAFAERLRSRKVFFGQPAPEGYAKEWADVLAAVPEQEQRLASVLEFQIAGRLLGLATHWVKAVSPQLTVCPVPHRDNTALLGLVAYGGEVIPCCSLARILGVADAAGGAGARTVVLEERPGERWAFLVDRVIGVTMRRVDVETAQPGEHLRVPPEWLETAYADDAGDVVQLLRPDVLFQRLQRATA